MVYDFFKTAASIDVKFKSRDGVDVFIFILLSRESDGGALHRTQGRRQGGPGGFGPLS